MNKLYILLALITATGCGPTPQCFYEKASNGILETCVDGTRYFYSNDEEIKNGTVKEMIEPCPEINVAYAEVILRMGDGTLIAFFATNGGFLSILSDGNYITTDGKNCHFSIVNGEVLW